MSKTIYITDGDALNIDRVVVSTGDLKGCKVFYSCDLIDEYEARLQADMAAMLTELQLEIGESTVENEEYRNSHVQSGIRLGKHLSKAIIQDKIDSLKGE